MGIRDLPVITSDNPLTLAASLPVAPENGAGTSYQATLAQVLTLIQSLFANPTFATTVAPVGASTAFDLGALASNLWLIGNPTGSEAGFNITLPTSPSDGQTIIVTCSVAFAATFAGSGAPAGFLGAIDGSVVIRYSASAGAWKPISAGGKGLVAPRIADSILDEDGNEVIGLGSNAGAVNYVEVDNAATGNAVRVAANGSDTDIDFDIESAGDGDLNIGAPGAGATNISSATGPVNITGTGGIARTFRAVAMQPATIAQLDALAITLGSPAGLRAMASDGNGVVFQAVQNGGGATLVPVYFDGLDWRNG